jgi:hypothetical protein
VDSSNIYFTYDGYNETSDVSGYGLAEVQNYATSPTFVDLIPIGTLGFWGGVNVGKNASFVSVIDQDARTVTQYSLPWTGSILATLGPTALNAYGEGDPVSAGWSKNDKNVVAGDGYGWLDSINCSYGCYGAAYSPSDK